jgi:hypothetical protein
VAIEFKGETSTNSQHKLPQLETKESPVELPAGNFIHHEIERTFDGLLWSYVCMIY